jgi:anti-anti-sigma factor
MDVKVEVVEGVTCVALAGKLDASTVADAERRLVEIIDGGANAMILELSALTYISSAGLRVLLVAAKKLKTKRGQLVLCGIQRYVKEVLDISGFSAVFPTAPDRTAALTLARPK